MEKYIEAARKISGRRLSRAPNTMTRFQTNEAHLLRPLDVGNLLIRRNSVARTQMPCSTRKGILNSEGHTTHLLTPHIIAYAKTPLHPYPTGESPVGVHSITIYQMYNARDISPGKFPEFQRVFLTGQCFSLIFVVRMLTYMSGRVTSIPIFPILLS